MESKFHLAITDDQGLSLREMGGEKVLEAFCQPKRRSMQLTKRLDPLITNRRSRTLLCLYRVVMLRP